MKKITFILSLFLASPSVFSQIKIVRNAYGVDVVQKSVITAEDSLTENRVIFLDSSEFEVYVDKKGRFFIVKVNKKTQQQYKKYIKWDNK